MIKINELRNGILLKANGLHEGKIMTVSHFENDGSLHDEFKPIIFFNENKGAVGEYLRDCEAIKLTDEIMENFGFEDNDGEFQHPDNTDFDLMICCSENKLWCAYNFALVRPDPYASQRVMANPICNPFKYVHQLQNLYFALTGKELNVQLSEPKVE